MGRNPAAFASVAGFSFGRPSSELAILRCRYFNAMSRNYLVFGDTEGKFDVLRVECTKCSRRGVYYLYRLIERHGRKGNVMKWKELLNGDCPRRDAHSPHERCDLVCPDLPTVL
jgi:hypothetical protein